MRRYLIGMTGASGAAFGVDFVQRCPGDKYLVMSDWARQVLASETGLKPSDLEKHVKKLYADTDLAAPFSSGSNPFDAYVIVPCSVSTMAKIAVGIADTLVTRAAAVALKERRRLVICVRETPLSSIALENAPPWYRNPADLAQLVSGFSDKVLGLLGEPTGAGWREAELE
jgi:4-hydroxy-3-polyprenylbenzoate decarboxylase